MNTTNEKVIDETFNEHSRLLKNTLEKHKKEILLTSKIIVKCFRNGGKVILFGNGGSAADSQHLAAEFVGRFLIERKSLPAIAFTANSSIVTAIGNDYGYDVIFKRQVESLVNKNDVVIAISTSGNSKNVIEGLKTARKKGTFTVGLSGKGGGRMADMVDVLIDIPTVSTPRIQEMHILVGHIICDLVEKKMFK